MTIANQSSPGAAAGPRRAARRWGRKLLRAWARTCRAPGYLYYVVDRWGARLCPLPPEDSLLEARLPGGLRLRCDLLEEVQRQIYFLGVYEPIPAYLLTRYLQPGMIVIDAGANAGQYTLLAAARVAPAGAVHSFEPVPALHARLVRHLELNRLDGVHAVCAALWHRHASVRLGLPQGVRGNSGAYSLGAACAAIEARALTLDEYVARQALPRVDVIKMDIEGAEPYALEGAQRTLERHHPLVLIEINRQCLRALGSEPGAIWRILRACGYRAWLPGYAAESSRELHGLEGIEQSTLFFHHGPLPAALASGWNYRRVLRWALGV